MDDNCRVTLRGDSRMKAYIIDYGLLTFVKKENHSLAIISNSNAKSINFLFLYVSYITTQYSTKIFYNCFVILKYSVSVLLYYTVFTGPLKPNVDSKNP